MSGTTFDNLTEQTRLLHNTKRKTQPWKTGLKVDYRPADTFQLFLPRHWLRAPPRPVREYWFAGTYDAHPDPKQERFFFELVRGCPKTGLSVRRNCCRKRSGRVFAGWTRWSWLGRLDILGLGLGLPVSGTAGETAPQAELKRNQERNWNWNRNRNRTGTEPEPEPNSAIPEQRVISSQPRINRQDFLVAEVVTVTAHLRAAHLVAVRVVLVPRHHAAAGKTELLLLSIFFIFSYEEYSTAASTSASVAARPA